MKQSPSERAPLGHVTEQTQGDVITELLPSHSVALLSGGEPKAQDSVWLPDVPP